MRNRSFATLGTLALLTAASAFGQQALTVDVPFEFNLGDKAMPAGHYDVTHTSGVLHISCFTCGAGAMSVISNIGNGNGISQDTQSRLVFSKYGDKYFLSEVWASFGDEWAAGLPKSRTEREMARTSPSEVARVAIPAGAGAVALVRAR